MKTFLTVMAVLTISSAVVILADQKNVSQNQTNVAAVPEVKIHLAGNPATSLKKVTAKIVYFMPKDLTGQTESDWRSVVDKTMRGEQEFYNFQLKNALRLNYEIYGSPVVGLENHLFYDSDVTDRGNPHALIAAREEVLKRIIAPTGDLYRADFVKPSSDYEIIIIIYGGTGASAMIYKQGGNGEDVVKIEDSGPPAIILSSAFLTSPLYREFGPTILAHEIGHAFGLDDSYDPNTGSNLGTDLMGEGRRRILSATYLSDENKKLLGL